MEFIPFSLPAWVMQWYSNDLCPQGFAKGIDAKYFIPVKINPNISGRAPGNIHDNLAALMSQFSILIW